MGTSSRIGRCIKAPLRVLCRARDLYIRSLTRFAGRMHYGGEMAYPAIAPASYSFRPARMGTGEDDDLRELIRAASLTQRGGRLPLQAPAVRKCQSLVIGRIDEDKPCIDFEDGSDLPDLLLPRNSRSCAVGARRRARSYV